MAETWIFGIWEMERGAVTSERYSSMKEAEVPAELNVRPEPLDLHSS